jgi:hypothetical protein
MIKCMAVRSLGLHGIACMLCNIVTALVKKTEETRENSRLMRQLKNEVTFFTQRTYGDVEVWGHEFLNFTVSLWRVSFTFRPLHPWRKKHGLTMNRKLSGTYSWSGVLREDLRYFN